MRRCVSLGTARYHCRACAAALKVVLQGAREERRPEKIDLLLSAFALVQHDPATKQVIQKFQQQKV